MVSPCTTYTETETVDASGGVLRLAHGCSEGQVSDVNDVVQQAAELIYGHETHGAGAEALARLLAEHGLLPTRAEYATGDGFGAAEEGLGIYESADDARGAAHAVCCGKPIMRRYVSEWKEVPSGGP